MKSLVNPEAKFTSVLELEESVCHLLWSVVVVVVVYVCFHLISIPNPDLVHVVWGPSKVCVCVCVCLCVCTCMCVCVCA